MDETSGLSTDSNLAVRLLRFLYVRREEITPVMSLETIFGYEYAKLGMFLDPEGARDNSIVKVLEYLESQAMLESRFHDKVHACARCGCSFLNFREICQHCQSANLHIDDLVHHFRCGHVAPEQEFHDGDSLSCPKCSRELKSLGTDYDKPSQVYICNECGHVSQDVDVSAVCFNCQYTAAPDEHNHRTLKRYSLTSLGENAALHGLDSLFRQTLSGAVNLVEIDTFKVFVEVERNRIQRYKLSNSSVIYFSIDNLGVMHLHLGDRAQTLFKELSKVVASVLRTSDVISPLNDSLYLALLVETPLDGARTALNRLHKDITDLLQANVSMEASMHSQAFSVDGGENASSLIARIMDQANEQSARLHAADHAPQG